jgi:hypothetical protein
MLMIKILGSRRHWNDGGWGFPQDAKHEIDIATLRLPMVAAIFVRKDFLALLPIEA